MTTNTFMTPTAAAGIELMAATANYQNKLRTLESHIAKEQTKAQSKAIDNQVIAIKASGEDQADIYRAQAAQSFASGALDGAQALQTATGWGCKQRDIQKEIDGLSQDVDAHKNLLNKVDEKINNPPVAGAGSFVGTSGSNAELTPEQINTKNDLERNFKLDKESEAKQLNELDRMRATPAKDASGNLIPGRTELDDYRKDLQRKIEHKEEMINAKMQTINTNTQWRGQMYDLTKNFVSGGSSMFQAVFTNEKAKADAESTQFGFVKEMGSNVFGAASQAMSDCNNQTEKMVDGITGALRHVAGQ